MKKNIYKMTQGRDKAFCWYCEAKTNGILTFGNSGDEIWSCENCAFLHGKIFKNRFGRYKHISRQKWLKITEKNKGKTMQTGGIYM